jgi:Zn-dependent protease
MVGRHAASWSLQIGRFAGVPVLLHFFFLMFVVLTFAVTLRDDMLKVGLLTLAVLLASVLLHELAHAWAAIRLGGQVDRIVIGPFGGLCSPRVPDEPEIQAFVALAGPLVNLSLAVVAAAALSLGTNVNLLDFVNPIVVPTGIQEGTTWHIVGKLTFWLNWTLLLINLLPAYPFDGGPALRATLWPVLGRRTACVVTSRVAMALAVGLCVLAFLPGLNSEPHPTVPYWVPLVTLGIFLFFSAQQDCLAAQRGGHSNDLAGYNVHGEGIDLLDELWPNDETDDDAVLVEQRSDQRLEHGDQTRRSEEEYEDAQVDDILARLHRSSIDQLTGEERALLERASQRYRRRSQSHDAD